jgi:hypothetical protein
MDFNFAYLSGGKLHLKLGQTQVQTVVSEFGIAAQHRVRQNQRRNSWKQPTPFGAMTLVKEGDREAGGLAVAIKGVCPTRTNRLLYSLEAGEVGGIFALDLPNSQEKRLFHSADFKIQQLDYNPALEQIACSVVKKDGSAHIAIVSALGMRLNEVTEGDSIDLAPKWVPDHRQILVFQSTGVGRNSAGYIVEHRHTTIEQLDLDNQELSVLASDPHFDLLSPQLMPDGTLYCIRRPYLPLRRRISSLRIVSDLVLMPFRLCVAVFQWLNFFTRRYTGKNLLNLDRDRVDRHETRHAILLGRWIDVRAQIERNRRYSDTDTPAMVPHTWELIRQQPHQLPTVIAHGVLSFDVSVDGTVIYSNGNGIYGIAPSGKPEPLSIDRDSIQFPTGIEQVVLLDSDRGNDLN